MTEINPEYLEEHWGLSSRFTGGSHATVGLAADFEIPINGALTNVPWDTELSSGGVDLLAALPSEAPFVIPVGVTHIKLSALCPWKAIAAVRTITNAFLKNGSTNLLLGRTVTQLVLLATNGSLRLLLLSPVIPVVAGDTFGVQMSNSHVALTNPLDYTTAWFSIEDVSVA